MEDKKQANWVYQGNEFHVSEKGALKIFSKDGKMLGIITAGLAQHIAENSSTFVGFINSSTYQGVLDNKSKIKLDEKLQAEARRQVEKAAASLKVLKEMGLDINALVKQVV